MGRTRPWGAAAPTNDLAVFGCQWGGDAAVCGPEDRAPVGSAPNGVGRFGQHDLAGSAWEWSIDWYHAGWYAGSGNPCHDCANLALPNSLNHRSMRCGSWNSPSERLRAAFRNHYTPSSRLRTIGLRCAGSPVLG